MVDRIWKKLYNRIADVSANLLPALLVIIALGVILFFYNYGPGLANQWAINRLDREAVGIVISVNIEKTITENLVGGKVTIGNFLLRYRYAVQGNGYVKEEYVSRKALRSSSYQMLTHIEPGDTISIKYDSDNPKVARWASKP